ncbi:MAG: oligosaccharide flippase family protein, partial [Candidatus Eremiobacterota bacterium]
MKQSNVTGLKQLIKNSFFNSAGWTIILLVNLITTPYIVFKLTIEGYGIYALLTSLIGYYNLFDIGLGQGVIKFVAEYKAKQDYNGIYRSINAALWVQLCTGLICSVSLILFSEAIIKLLNISPAYYTDVKIGLYISAAGFFFSFLSGTFTSTLMGLQRYDITSKINVSINFLLNIFTILILYLGAGLKEVIYLNSFSAIFSFIICYIFLT